DWRHVASMYDYASGVRSVRVTGTSKLLQIPELAVIDGILGMVDEVGEVAELVIPVLKGEKTATEISEKLHDELGDVMWYIARTAESAGISMASVAQGNLAKLEARYPSGFDPNASQNRNLDAEDQARQEAGKDSNNKEDILIKAITEMKVALDATIMSSGKVALKGEADKIDLLQKAYDNINKTLEEVYND
ncbi:MAG: MazG nucleotide pyrophosphohydrolase domain-containing protein, partial [Cetobacterium sp.]